VILFCHDIVENTGCEEEFEDNQRGNQNPYIEEEHITQWPKEKVQRTNNDLQNIHIKLRILITPLIIFELFFTPGVWWGPCCSSI
jgi:hypothetical protein